MEWIGLGARLVLALVFTTAAVGKLADLSGTRSTLEDFRVPVRLLAPFALLLPAAELATAAALIVQPSARFGAIAALALLLAFAAGIAGAMARGEAPDCNCFGQLGSAPAGGGTLIRNAALAAPAVLVLAYGPGKTLGTWLPTRSAAEVVAAVAALAALALSALCLRLVLLNKELREDVDRVREATAAFPAGLPIGAKAPGFAVRGADGRMITLEALLEPRKPVALVFMSRSCGPCMMMLPNVVRWQRRLADGMTIALLTQGTRREFRDFAEYPGLANVLADDKSKVFQLYRGHATPSVVILTPDGRIGSPMRATQLIVEELIRQALRANEAASMPQPPAAPNGEAFTVRQWSSTAGA
jgi:uncharacterized membrane protein YphA (DoxX/SURF4 family)/peroxiredoxin